MEFINWCHHVLQTLEDEKFNSHLSTHALQNILFGEATQQSAFHTSDARHGMFHAITSLKEAGLAAEEPYRLKITPLGREILLDPTDYWAAVICGQKLDPEEEALLQLVNKLSPQEGADPDHAWLKDVGRDDVLAAFNIAPPPMKSNEHHRELDKYIYQLPKLLESRHFLKTKGRPGYHNFLKPTYQGLVWGTRCGSIKPKITTPSVSKFGIPDHMAFQAVVSTLNPEGGFVSVIFLDLDNFKSVNDTYSHKVGDQVIEDAIRLVQSATKGKGELFHRSGDEMLVLLPNFSESEAHAVGEHIRQAIERHEFPTIGKGHVTATLGVATYPTFCKTLGELEEVADITAMRAKRQKNVVVLASQLDSQTK